MNRSFMLLLASLALLGPTGCARSEAGAPITATAVEVTVVKRDRTQRSGSLVGRVEAVHTATISAEVADRLVRRPVKRGDRVLQGSVLMQFRDDTASQQLAQAEAGALRAVAALHQAQAGLQRVRVETRASVVAAEAGVTGATAQATKSRSYTRVQELKAAQAALSAAQADEVLARKELVRFQALVASDAAPRQALDRAEAGIDAAQARRCAAEEALSLAREGARREDQASASAHVTQAQASLEAAQARPHRLAELEAQVEGLAAQVAEARAVAAQARIRLDRCCIRAPFDGVVLDTRLEVGELATPGQPVIKIGDVRQVKALFSVPEATRPSLHLRQALDVTADALAHRTFHGRLQLLGAEADARNRTFPLEVLVDNPRRDLLPNMVVRLELQARSATPSLTVPMTCVVSRGANPAVFVIRDHVAHARTVRLAQPRGDSVEIVEGLAEGDCVATTPIRLAEGQKVQEVTP